MPDRVNTITSVAVLLLTLLPVAADAQQCILYNPSFEITDPGYEAFEGWEQFGLCPR